MTHEKPVSCSYAVLSFVLDSLPDLSIPVGVVLWSPQGHYVKVYMIQDKDKLKGIDPHMDLPIIRLAHDQIVKWIRTGQLPHLAEPVCDPG